MASIEEQPAFCADCLTGFSWSGNPSGQEKKLGSFDTVYIASSENTKDQPAILLFTDVFGFNLQNPKLLADKIHEATGWAVYVPDLFYGNAPTVDDIYTPRTPEELREQGLVSKIKNGLTTITILPWFLKNSPASKMDSVKSLIEVVRGPEYGHTKIGTIGYCYGAKIGADLNIAGLTDCTVFAHPSFVTKDDLANLKTPTSFAIPEVDDRFGPPMVECARATLMERNLAFELEVYEGTCHGFASRGDLTIEKVKKGFEGSIMQAVNWFKKYLS